MAHSTQKPNEAIQILYSLLTSKACLALLFRQQKFILYLS